MPQYVYLKLGYDADKTTKEDAIAMLSEYGGINPELLSLKEIGGISKDSDCLKLLNTIEALEYACETIQVIRDRNDVTILIDPLLNILYEKIFRASELLEGIDWEKLEEGK